MEIGEGEWRKRGTRKGFKSWNLHFFSFYSKIKITITTSKDLKSSPKFLKKKTSIDNKTKRRRMIVCDKLRPYFSNK